MPEPQDPGGLTELAPTPLQGLTSSLGLVPESKQLIPGFMAAGAEREAGLKASAERKRAELEDLRTAGAEHEKAAAAARPAPVTLTAPPSTEARGFLTPGKNVLDQLQQAMLGITQMALGIGGLKGRGHAMAAVAGLKGALQGWQAGDRERADAALKDWEAASKVLLEGHRSRREAYADLLTDQKRSMEARLAEIWIRAAIDGDEDAARAAKQGNVGDLINILGQREQQERQHEDRMTTLRESIAQHQARSAQIDRAFEATERSRAEMQRARQAAGARAERGISLREEFAAGRLKLEKEDDAISNGLRQMTLLEESIARLDARGVIPKGPTMVDKVRASVALQTSFGDAQVAQDIQNVQRMGTALLVGSEIAAGLSPSVARLKVIGEAEAAGATAIPKSFWDQWFVRQREMLTERRATVRRHLKARTPTVPGDTDTDEAELLWKED